MFNITSHFYNFWIMVNLNSIIYVQWTSNDLLNSMAKDVYVMMGGQGEIKMPLNYCMNV